MGQGLRSRWTGRLGVDRSDVGDGPRSGAAFRRERGQPTLSYRSLRTSLLVVHLARSVGLFGAVLVFFCLALTGLLVAEPDLVNASYAVMPTITWSAEVPLAAASLAVGMVQSLTSPWGLIRHYWVVVKLAMTVFITSVVLIQTPTINRLGAAGIRSAAVTLDWEARYSVLVHSGAGLAALLVVLDLSIAKPRGLTGWGQRPRSVNAPKKQKPGP